MAKIVFKIAVNVTPLMSPSGYRTLRISGYASKTVSDLFVILLLLQTFLGIFSYRPRHDATNRSDTSLRQVASSALLLRQVACPCFVAAICRTNSNQFEFVRQIAATNSVAATMIFTCHTRRFVAATCRGDLSHRVSRPYSCVSV